MRWINTCNAMRAQLRDEDELASFCFMHNTPSFVTCDICHRMHVFRGCLIHFKKYFRNSRLPQKHVQTLGLETANTIYTNKLNLVCNTPVIGLCKGLEPPLHFQSSPCTWRFSEEKSYFFAKISHLTLTYEPFRQKKGS